MPHRSVIRALLVLALLAWLTADPPTPASAGPRLETARSASGTRRTTSPGKRRSPTRKPLARIVQTTQDLTNALTVMPPQRFTARRPAAATVIRVSPSVHYQKMLGFGAAMTDSSAWLLHRELSSAQRKSTLAALFSSAGIDLNFVRIPMGATDYTVSGPYSYDDMPPGRTDRSMKRFSIAHDRANILPMLREMLAVNPRVFTLASPWSAPPWMKQNQAFNNAGLAGIVEPRYYRAFARYFVDFLRDYSAAGVPIDAITPMNEPNSPSGWPGTYLSPADDATFLPRDLAPALRRARLKPQIFGDDDTELADARALLAGPAARDLHGIAFHCYQGMTQMSKLHAEHSKLPLLVTECSPGIAPYATAEVPIDAARNWASGVQLWNLALDSSNGPFEGAVSFGCGGCTGVIAVDQQTRRAGFGLNYYQFGQTTKYVKPGARRIASTRLVTDGFGIGPGVDNVAYQNPDGSIVLVAYNNSTVSQAIAISYRRGFLSYQMAPFATDTFVWH